MIQRFCLVVWDFKFFFFLCATYIAMALGAVNRILLCWVNSVLKSLLQTFTHTKNAPVEL